MGTLTRVRGMELQPNCCVICGSNPADFNGEQQEAIFAEGVDIDWGNSLYICWDCGNIIASLVRRPNGEYVEALEKKHESLLEEHSKLEEEHEELQAEVDRIREGVAASKRIRARTATR